MGVLNTTLCLLTWRRRAEALGLEGDWRATTSDGKSSVDGSSEIGSGREPPRALKSLRAHLRWTCAKIHTGIAARDHGQMNTSA